MKNKLLLAIFIILSSITLSFILIMLYQYYTFMFFDFSHSLEKIFSNILMLTLFGGTTVITFEFYKRDVR